MAYNQYDLANTSLVNIGNLTEMYLPLWYYSNSYATANVSGGGGYFLQKGVTSVVNSVSGTTKLHTLNSAWSTTQKFAFEASIFGSTSETKYAALWDMTTNTIVGASQVSVVSLTSVLLRSGVFTLTPGHIYGVSLWGASTAATNLTKASLIAFLS